MSDHYKSREINFLPKKLPGDIKHLQKEQRIQKKPLAKLPPSLKGAISDSIAGQAPIT